MEQQMKRWRSNNSLPCDGHGIQKKNPDPNQVADVARSCRLREIVKTRQFLSRAHTKDRRKNRKQTYSDKMGNIHCKDGSASSFQKTMSVVTRKRASGSQTWTRNEKATFSTRRRTPALLLASELEVLAALDLHLMLDLAHSALKTQNDLLGGLSLFVENRLCLSSEPALFPVVPSLSLSVEACFACLVLSDFVKSMFPALFSLAERIPRLRNIHHVFLLPREHNPEGKTMQETYSSQ
eukprot:CAMPEP_0196652382 /NCGR_PEP_ID=MMETSP1086-20130531/1647_1 /TAXON_ID=77921 /ORGANISM="Cyanoptyche  gloeocystis , Strain SAG4.97" /LENGTH=237 /DNA_ID=CAMNT_0041982895 /DNA_START=49 /DNA_END=760 /DNA_ORIENTATION=-